MWIAHVQFRLHSQTRSNTPNGPFTWFFLGPGLMTKVWFFVFTYAIVSRMGFQLCSSLGTVTIHPTLLQLPSRPHPIFFSLANTCWRAPCLHWLRCVLPLSLLVSYGPLAAEECVYLMVIIARRHIDYVSLMLFNQVWFWVLTDPCCTFSGATRDAKHCIKMPLTNAVASSQFREHSSSLPSCPRLMIFCHSLNFMNFVSRGAFGQQ